MTEEVWRAVPGLPNYEASTLGRVRGPRGVLKGYADNGYLRVSIDRGRTKRTVHSLVALAFHGERPGRLEIDHINGDRQDNRSVNLRYVSKAENEANKAALGNIRRGQAVPSAKLTEAQVREILREYDGARGYLTRAARRYGVRYSTIGDIVRGRTWGWVASSRAFGREKAQGGEP